MWLVKDINVVGSSYGLIALRQKTWPVFDGVRHVAAVDVVEGGGIGPVELYIVDFEMDICWRPLRLGVSIGFVGCSTRSRTNYF